MRRVALRHPSVIGTVLVLLLLLANAPARSSPARAREWSESLLRSPAAWSERMNGALVTASDA
ncbi:MAG TPA: hypothetical protein GX715_18230, partial [Armatimonadetes bacterium]|nr:hypothetical protein [Armatimonadota bacterium]